MGWAIIALFALGIMAIINLKAFKHKIFATAIVCLILFIYLSSSYVLADKNINLATISGLEEATSVYLTWLIDAFGNVKSITTNAVKMDWGIDNETINFGSYNLSS